MTDQPSGAEGVPEWDPFRSDDPEIRFLIATIVTAAVLLSEEPQNVVAMRSLLYAASQLKETVNERQG